MSAGPEAALELTQPVSAGARILLARLRRLQAGELHGTFTDGNQPFRLRARQSGPRGTITLHTPWRLLARCALRGDVGFAESYIAGDWDSPDLPALLEVMAINESAFAQREITAVSRLELAHHRWRNRNTRRGSRRNIAAHYDLGNAFYRLWLDETMTYSGAVFRYPDESLAAAQRNKYDGLLDALQARAGEHILEIGCGWGGFAQRAAERGLRITAVTLSREQLDYARERMHAAGLDDTVTLRLQDYRDIAGAFDHIVSIEMLEAVGEAYWPEYFRRLAARVRPGGRIALQAITLDEARFAAYRRNPDFIQRYIFPGGMLPTVGRLRAEAARAGLVMRMETRLGGHYADTLQRWLRHFDAASETVAAQGFDERFRRMWRYYLAYCEAGFRCGRVDLQRLVLERAST